MSLISDALKEAQRERSGRSGQPGTPLPADNFFPLPADRDRGRPRLALIGGVGVAAIIVASVVWWSTSHLFSRAGNSTHVVTTRPPASQRTPTQTAATAPAPVPSHDSVRSPQSSEGPKTVVSPTANVPRAVATLTPPGSARTSVSRNRASQHSPPAQPAATVTDTVAATLVSTATVQPPATSSAPAASASQGVRIIIDAPSVRPADSLFKLAYAEHLKGNFDRARELYEQTIAMQQAPSEAYNDYGVLLSQHGNPTAAAEMFRVAVRRDDANAEAWINLGDTYYLAGRHADALSAFSRAIQLDPGSVPVKIRLAGEYHAIGDSVTARRLYDESLKAAPRDPAVHYELAKFLQAQQDYRGAAREFQQFVDLAGGKYDARTIDAVRQHVASLEKSAR